MSNNLSNEDRKKLESEVAQVLNNYSIENSCNTPDFILASLMVNALESFIAHSNRRENWYGKHLSINGDQGRWQLEP